MSVISTISINLQATLSKVLQLGTGEVPVDIKNNVSLVNGVLANQSDLIFSGERTLGAGANEDLDLSGALLDAFGDAVIFVKVKGIVIESLSANLGDIVVGGAAINGFIDWVGAATDTVKIKPGGSFGISAPDLAGYAVTPGTADLLRITNGDGSNPATYQIGIIGTSS